MVYQVVQVAVELTQVAQVELLHQVKVMLVVYLAEAHKQVVEEVVQGRQVLTHQLQIQVVQVV
jgi:hypothetical protein